MARRVLIQTRRLQRKTTVVGHAQSQLLDHCWPRRPGRTVRDVAILSPRLPEVAYSFTSAADPGSEWKVLRVHVTEGISEMYVVTLDLVSDNAEPNDLLDESGTFEIRRASIYRKIHGIVIDTEHRGKTDQGQTVCRVVLLPALHSLSLRTNSRVWVERTVLEIVSELLREGLTPTGREFDMRTLVAANYLRRPLCVQYNETDYDFCCRLLAEEGIWFGFQHVGEHETLVLYDSVGAYQRALTMDLRGRLPLIPANAETAEIESLQWFYQRKRVISTAVVKHGRDYTRPDVDLTAASRDRGSSASFREDFGSRPEFQYAGYNEDAHTFSQHDGAKRVRLDRESRATHALMGNGTSNASCLEPARIATLGDATRGQPEDKRLIVSIEHRGFVPEVLRGAEISAHSGTHEPPCPRYVNRFRAVSQEKVFIPRQQHRRPRIEGTLTGVVVGPRAGSSPDRTEDTEIHTDRHGRVKVQLFWDRYGRRDDKSFAWVRVLQQHAGTGWGSQFIPRVGMEVVISFEDGNPDRPMVIGCLYNGTNQFPFHPDEHPDMQAIRSHSTPGGSEMEYNEIRMIDTRGQEELGLRAQKNMVENVLHDHTTTVDHDQRNEVHHNQSEQIDGTQSLSVGGDRSKSVSGNEQNKVHLDRTTHVEGNDTTSVHLDQKLTVDGAQHVVISTGRDVRVEQEDKLTVQGKHTVHVTENETRHVDGELKTESKKLIALHSLERFTVQGDVEARMLQGKVELSMANDSANLKAGGTIQIESDDGTLTFGAMEGAVIVKAKEYLKLQCGSASITLTSDGNIVLKGIKIGGN